MKLHFLGANRQVTGSRYCLEFDDTYVMIDCGLFQEREYLARNWNPSPIPPDRIHALLLTHVHIDHCGLIPKLVKEGFRGPIYCTHPTAALARIMLLDSARIQTEDAAYKKKRHEREGRRGKFPEVPLYTEEDAERVFPLLQPIGYDAPIDVTDHLTVRFRDAGHILGSALLEMEARDGDLRRTLLFSGDLGQFHKPIIRDPTFVSGADYVIMESTYGDRNHEQAGPIVDQLADAIGRTIERGGNVVIPTFAVERAQELIYYISDLVHHRRIPDVPVFLDSPMASDVTEIFRQFSGYYDEETWRRLASHVPPLRFPTLQFSRTVEQSKRINEYDQPCVIMSTSGMCNEGRIKHHLRHNIEHSKNMILFVGHQAQGTLGRRILDGEPRVRIHGREYHVRAEVRQIAGFSGHADQQGLLAWLAAFEHAPQQLFLTHGEESAAETLSQLIREKFTWQVAIPHYQNVFKLQ